MKTKYNIILYKMTLLLMAVSLSGCDLDRFPQDTVTPESFFKSESDLELWTNRFYNLLDNVDDNASRNADDVVDNLAEDYIAGTRSASTESGWSWGQLRNINYMLEHIGNCKDDAVRTEYEGVAYFFRAYFYYVKVRRYGDVPWYDKVIGSDEAELLTKARDDRGYVMDKVMEDYDKAVSMLSSTKNVARVNKWTALAFKSRAALFEGTFRKYHGLDGADKYLELAANAAEQVITSGGYSLNTSGMTPYRDLFDSDKAIATEVILARIYNFEDLNIATSVQNQILNERQGFTRRFMNHYLMADGTRFSEKTGNETMSYYEETQSRDPRMAQTVLCPGYVQVGSTKTSVNDLNALTGYRPIKYVAESIRDAGSKGTADFPLMRLAEVYLNFAEAKAELGTLTQSDLDKSVNRIRSRAKMPSLDLSSANASPDPLMESYYPNVTKSSNEGVILEIRRERTIEMVMEGNRVWDLLRWKEGAQMANTVNKYLGCYFPGVGTYDMDKDGTIDIEIYSTSPVSSAPKKFLLGSDIILSGGTSGNIVAYSTITYSWNEERDYLWPIPAAQRELSHGKLTQNPGWSDGLDF